MKNEKQQQHTQFFANATKLNAILMQQLEMQTHKHKYNAETHTHTLARRLTHIDALASQLFSCCCSYCCILLCALAFLCRCNYCYCCCCCYSFGLRCFCLFPAAAPLPLHSATVLHNVNYIFACYHHKNIIIYSFSPFSLGFL